ncbi:hypothetical protein sos41_32440 [Alphaproteobacteria bacterium SO-S41]|nr:hypothetical protein sos41_32440 [Alphaproteobacteria bacterium SO-S41]
MTAADVPTAHASRYLQQLAKHWSHKFKVAFTPTEAAIELPLGLCKLTANDARLHVVLTPVAGADLGKFQSVVADHLQRFGHKETLVFDWREAA